MPRRRWTWGPGFLRGLGLDANKVGAELTAIAKEHGGCTPDLLVDVAEAGGAPESSKAITWDVAKAARLRQLQEARGLLQQIRGPKTWMYEFVRCRETPEELPRYWPVKKVVEEPLMHEDALDSALRLLEGSLSRYHFLVELKPVRAAVASIRRMQKELKHAKSLNGAPQRARAAARG